MIIKLCVGILAIKLWNWVTQKLVNTFKLWFCNLISVETKPLWFQDVLKQLAGGVGVISNKIDNRTHVYKMHSVEFQEIFLHVVFLWNQF